MKTVDVIDMILSSFYINKKSHVLSFSLIDHFKTQGIKVEENVLWEGIQKLHRDGYLRKVFLDESLPDVFESFNITIDGILFIENASIQLRPYYSNELKERKDKRFQLLKTGVIVLNAVALLLISGLSVWVQSKANDNNEKVNKLEKENQDLKLKLFKIDQDKKSNIKL